MRLAATPASSDWRSACPSGRTGLSAALIVASPGAHPWARRPWLQLLSSSTSCCAKMDAFSSSRSIASPIELRGQGKGAADRAVGRRPARGVATVRPRSPARKRRPCSSALTTRTREHGILGEALSSSIRSKVQLRPLAPLKLPLADRAHRLKQLWRQASRVNEGRASAAQRVSGTRIGVRTENIRLAGRTALPAFAKPASHLARSISLCRPVQFHRRRHAT